MTRNHIPHPEMLVAIDFGPVAGVVPDIDVLTARLDNAAPGCVLAVDSGTQPHWQTGDPQPVHRVTFDAALLRNTEAHGFGHRAGFVSHIEVVDAPRAP